jgi:glyoxylase-like metal-dependent hydrolase (beta-lactamase superfamily II)
MRVHHLSCGTMCPVGGQALSGIRALCCHVLLVESDDGLVLVDTGFGTADLTDPGRRLGRAFAATMGVERNVELSAWAQVEKLGFRETDVRHVVLTHLDLDHAGGLGDFPRARVHLTVEEHDAAAARASLRERLRYRPAQWAHGPDWAPHVASGESWMGFASVAPIPGLGDELLIVPLHGHTRGHAAIAVRDGAGWLLHCGDAYFHHDEMGGDERRCPRAFDLYQKGLAMDRAAWRRNQMRLRALQRERADEVRLFCAHDPEELERFAVGGR